MGGREGGREGGRRKGRCVLLSDQGLPINYWRAKFHSFCNCSFRMANNCLDSVALHV